MKKSLCLTIILSFALNIIALPGYAAQAVKKASPYDGIDLFVLKDKNQAGSVTIDEAVQIAMEQNSTIRIAQKTAQIYDQQVRQYWSYVYPKVTLDGSYTRTLRKQEMITSLGRFSTGYDNMTSGTAEASILLWTGGVVSAGIRMADYYSQGGYMQLAETQNQIQDLVRTLCFGIILSHALIQVQQENLNIAKDHLSEINLKYKQGLASDLDVLNQKVKVSNSEPPLIQAKNDYEIGLLTLRRLLNKDAQDQLSLYWQPEDVLSIKIPGLEDLYGLARQSRPELVVADLNVKIAREEISIAKADNYGEISAFVNATYSGSSDHVIIPASKENSSYGANAGLRISIPLFEGFRVSSIIKQKQLSFDQAVLTQQDAERNVRIAVKTAWLNFGEAKQRIIATQGTIAQARKNLERTNVRYRNGLASRLDLDDSALLLHDAELQFVQAVHDAFTALSNLNYAVGKEVIIK